MSDFDSIPVPRKGFVLEELDGETLLYRHSLKKLVYLNDSAASVWKLCDGLRTVREIAGLLQQAYPEAGHVVATDVGEAVENLVREGALRITNQIGQPDGVEDVAE